MKWRVFSKSMRSLFWRLYGTFIGAGIFFSASIYFFGAPHSRESLALTSATLCVAIGVLMTGFFWSQGLSAAGVRAWVAKLALIPFALLPAVLMFLIPHWAAAVLALSWSLFYFSAEKSEVLHAG